MPAVTRDKWLFRADRYMDVGVLRVKDDYFGSFVIILSSRYSLPNHAGSSAQQLRLLRLKLGIGEHALRFQVG